MVAGRLKTISFLEYKYALHGSPIGKLKESGHGRISGSLGLRSSKSHQ